MRLIRLNWQFSSANRLSYRVVWYGVQTATDHDAYSIGVDAVADAVNELRVGD